MKTHLKALLPNFGRLGSGFLTYAKQPQTLSLVRLGFLLNHNSYGEI